MTAHCECPNQAVSSFCIPISPELVRDALSNLVYSATQRPPSPLIYLILVDEVITDWPCSPQIREFILATLLVDLITNRFAAHWHCFNLPTLEVWATQSDALIAISTQAKTESVELMGWCWLYAHFVRVELAISPQLFSEAAGIDLRTLRRYQHHAITRLTLCLLEHEHAARQQKNRVNGVP